MESTKKKAGRPKSEPRKGPLVLEGTQKRETILTEVSADTAQELSEYAAWVRESAPTKMTPAEAVSKTVNFAVSNLFARDKCWHEYKRANGRPPAAGETPPSPSASSPASPTSPVSRTAPVPVPSALPPPGGRGGRTGSQTSS
jgi:hypothetical protein